MKSVLICSPIRQKPEILKQFLQGIEEIDKTGLKVSYFFVDDNTDEKSIELLKAFSCKNDGVLLKKGHDVFTKNEDNNYICDGNSHNWNTENIRRITCFKNTMIKYCIEKKIDYVFFIDSDIITNRNVLLHLISRNVEIVSNVFWSQWHINESLVPQCFWIPDLYNQYKSFNQPLPFEEANKIKAEMIERLKIPGIYKVDGLGACTLISRTALEKGVDFTEIPNLSIPGEDRHFCIRAGALGINLYMDTVYPAYHIFREEYLSRVGEFKNDGFKFDMCQTFVAEKKEEKKEFILKKIIKKFLTKALRRLG